MDIREMIGQRLALGFEGTTLTQHTISLIRDFKIGNVILFRDNILDKDHLRTLCSDIQNLVLETTGYPAFITIDQEGGMVTRLPDDMVNVPGNMAIAATGNPANAYQMARITARQLRGVGVNFNLAPVLDVNSNAENPVIGMRSYGDDPNRVAEFGTAAIRGYLGEGILCCAKHFPGHGDTYVDSHLGLPVIDKSLAELWQNELIPFQKAIAAGIPAIMTSHILFPQIELNHVPCTMSRRIMHDLLRTEMGFDGLILSDALEMEAIRKHYGISRGAIEAMKADVDIVFQCLYPDIQRGTFSAILEAAESGEIPLENIEESYNRIITAKTKYAFTNAQPELAANPEDFSAAYQTAGEAVTLYEGTHQPLIPGTVFICPEDYRMNYAANAIEYNTNFITYMEEKFNAPGIVCSTDPSVEEIADIVSQAKHYQNIIFGTFNAYLFRGQLTLAEALAETGLPITFIVLRNPYDLTRLPSGFCKVAVFDNSLCGLHAAEHFLLTGQAHGIMPVKL